MRLTAWGDRPSCFAASSSEVQDLASSINRRSSLNDQGLRAMSKLFLSQIQDKAAKRPMALDGFAWVGPGSWGKPGAKMDMRSVRLRNKQRGLS